MDINLNINNNVEGFLRLSEPEKKKYLAMLAVKAINSASFCNVEAVPNFGWGERSKRLWFCRNMYNDTVSGFNVDPFDMYQNINNSIQTKQEVTNKAGQKEIRDVILALPASIKHIPMVRPMINAVLSYYEMLPETSRVMTTDARSVNKKMEQKIKDTIDYFKYNVDKKNMALEQQRMILEMQQQLQNAKKEVEQESIKMKMQQEAGGQPDPMKEYELKTALANIEQSYFGLTLQLEQNLQRANVDAMIGQKQAKVIDDFYQKSYKDNKEQNMQMLLTWYQQHRGLISVIKKGFEEKLIHDEAVIFCDWQPGMKFVETRNVYPENFDYSRSESLIDPQKVFMTIERRVMTMAAIVDEYQLTGETYKKLRERIAQGRNLGNEHFGSTTIPSPSDIFMPDGQMALNPYSARHYNESTTSSHVHVVNFRIEEPIEVLYSKNKHGEDRPDFVKILKPEEAAKLRANGARLIKKGQKIEKRYRNFRWQVICTGGTSEKDIICLEVGKTPFQYRAQDDMGNSLLPYIFKSQNKYERPFSIIWETRNLASLYNNVYYQFELMLNLAGVKGNVYDISQKPKGMKLKEVMLYKKMGLMLIQSMNSDAGMSNPNFNQFQSYDDTLSQSVTLLIAMMERIEKHCMFIIGISPQFMAQIAATDQVGTFKQSVDLSSRNIDKFFAEYDVLKSALLSRFCNLAYHAHKDGFQGQVMLGEERQQILNIEPMDEDEPDPMFRASVRSNKQEGKLLDEARVVASAAFKNGQIKGSDYIQVQLTDNITDLVSYLREKEELYEKMSREAADASEQKKIELMNQGKKEIEELKIRLQENLLKIQQDKNEIERQLTEKELQLKKEMLEKQIQSNEKVAGEQVDIKKYAADLEYSIEQAYLSKEQRAVDLSDQNQKLGLFLDNSKNAINFAAKISTTSQKERVKD